MNRTLWVIQILLAALFLFAGAAKFVVPAEEMTKGMPGWLTASLLHFVTAHARCSGAIGLILPSGLAEFARG